jgi:hypothetical protein
MLTSSQLKHVVAEARPLIEKQLDLAEMITGLRDVVSTAGGDWGQLKALIKAQIQDERDEAGDGKRVRKILDKADFASAYADMLGLAGGNLNEENFFDPDTGEIQPGSTPEAGEGAAALAPADQSGPVGYGAFTEVVTPSADESVTSREAVQPALPAPHHTDAYHREAAE